ncbi:DEAD/DEAH box helicase [Actinomyces sp. HMT897]|uniref:DEAD/DEAH box helicase n=1 Tax=Actinomyces sp. HMT897 TaxID=2789424 RepID=UPI001FEDB71E|nr:DEAD/DEAH box helicase [Actinomyces sp. HMT897]
MARTIDGRIVSKKVDGWDTEARHGDDVDQLHGYADEAPRHPAPARQDEAPPRVPSAQTRPSPGWRASTPAGGSAVGERPSPVHRRAEEVLRALVGVPTARLHQDQWRAIEALVVGHRRVLVVQRTGWGKSAVYFVATVLLREGWGTWRPGDPPPRPGAGSPPRPGAGPTVIVSPLLALMRDQVAAASRAGIHAVTMNSANATQWDQIQTQVRAGEVDVLLVSPERLNNPVFREEVLPHLAAGAGLVVIDEAHCISDWGHDFRPDYRRIRTLLASLPPRTPVLATTATANARVTADVAEQLETSTGRQAPTTARQAPTGRVKDAAPSAPAAGSTPAPGGTTREEAASASRRYSTPTGGAAGSALAGGDPAGPGVLVLRGSLQRDSLHLGVRILPDAATRLAWLAAYLQHVPGSGIVYCLTVAAAGEVTEHLRQAGLEVATYTGQTDPAEREHLEEDLKANRVKALVATSALGMGFDKPDLTFVVHVGAPSSPVSYYQQVGRAGRGVERAEVVLLPGREDRSIWEWFGSQGFPPEEEVRAVLEGMAARQAAGGGPMSTPALETLTSLRRTRLESMLKVLDVDGAVRRVRGGWEPTGRPWVYDADRYARVEAARLAEQEAMVAYEHLGAEHPGARRGGVVPRLGGAPRPADDVNRGGTGAGTVAGAGTIASTGACRMAFLRQALDDPEVTEGWRCGACDLCGGLVLPQAPDAGQVGAARQALARTGVELRARRQWPTGMDRLGLARYRGRIGVDEQAGAGMALGRLDGLGISAPLRDLVLSGRDGEVPRALRAPFLEVVDRLGEVVRQADAGTQAGDEGRGPLAVVIVDSRTRPRLVRQLGRAVANRLRGRALGIVGVSGDEPPRHDVGSAFRLAQVARSLSLGAWSAAALGRLQGATVVLVDDWTGSGWTLTVATSLLRQAGAAAVHPLVLAQR